MTEVFPFFIVLLAGLIFSRVFRSFHVPWTVALIASGLAIGPYGLQLITPDPTLEFLKYLGLVFLMFMAGLETRFSGFREVWKESSFIGTMTGLIPFAIGILIGHLLGYESHTIILLGIVFISSSIAIAVPVLEKENLFHSRLGKTIVSSIVLQDIASLVLLAVVLQYLTPGMLPFPMFVTLFVLTLFIVALVRWGVPRLRKIFENKKRSMDRFERDLRITFVVLIGTVIMFEIIGLHAIVGAFLAGLILSEIIQEKALKEKIYVMAYGLFIPVFFVMIGVDINIEAFLAAQNIVLLVLIILLGSMLSKFASGWISGKIVGFTSLQSTLVGGTCIPQLSTTLAVITIGQQYNLLPEELVTTLIILSVVTIFVSPLAVNRSAEKVRKSYFVTDPAKENDTPKETPRAPPSPL